MSTSKKLILDANILLRGVFGVRVRQLLEAYQEAVDFYTPETCVAEALRHIPRIAKHKSLDPAESEKELHRLIRLFIGVVDESLYGQLEEWAHLRIAARDVDDWPVVAASLLINAPIWTEDRDFFGSGIATWTTDRIEIYLRDV
jgi:predicted nucleic acid-binding protein